MLSIKLISSSIRGVVSLASIVTPHNGSSNLIIAPEHNQPDLTRQLNNFNRSLSTNNLQQAAHTLTLKNKRISTDLLEADADLPSKPKKPYTPWIAFLRDRKEDVLRRGPMKASELTSILAREWKETDKTRYEQEFHSRQEEYYRAVEDYERSLTDQQRQLIKIKKNLKRENKAVKQLRATKPPTLPRNPANLYCIERCKELDVKERMKLMKSAIVLKELFDEYRDLSDLEKEKYSELQQKDKLRFQQEFNRWHDGIQSDPSMSKTVREKAKILHAKFKALNYL